MKPNRSQGWSIRCFVFKFCSIVVNSAWFFAARHPLGIKLPLLPSHVGVTVLLTVV